MSVLFDKFYLAYPLKYSVYLFYRFYNIPILILLVSSLKISRNKDGQNNYYNEALSKKLFKLWLIVLFSLSPFIIILNIAVPLSSTLEYIAKNLNFNTINNRFGHDIIVFINGTYLISLVIILLSVLLFYRLKILLKIFILPSLPIIVAAIYFTYFRVYYLGIILSVFSLILLYSYKNFGYKNKIHKFIIYALPCINFIITVAVISFIVLINIQGNNPFNSSLGLVGQLGEWQFMLNKFILNGNILNLLFGHGIIQYGQEKIYPWKPNIPALLHLKPSLLLFDNTYLQVVLYNGIISLVFFLALFVYIWTLLLKLFSIIPEGQFYFYAYVITIFATLPAMFMFDNFNSLYNIYAVIPAFIVLISYNKNIKLFICIRLFIKG